jgi:predicted transcriptional regulator
MRLQSASVDRWLLQPRLLATLRDGQLLPLVSDIVAAHVSNHVVPGSELSRLILDVHMPSPT